jgi:predicted  nucleic acid-binding Zn ribbon protein
MFVAQISWQIPATSTPAQLDEISYSLLAAYRKNGQIINWDWPIAISGELMQTFVMILEPEALDLKYASKYVSKEIAAAIDLGLGNVWLKVNGIALILNAIAVDWYQRFLVR